MGGSAKTCQKYKKLKVKYKKKYKTFDTSHAKYKTLFGSGYGGPESIGFGPWLEIK